MSLLNKIKQFFGMGTVSVKLQAPGTFKTSDGEIKGNVTILGKSDQIIESVELELKETYTTGRGDDKTEKEFKIGSIKLPGFEIKSGETKVVEYTLPFTYSKSDNEDLAEKGGVLGGIGKMASFATNEKSTFEIVCTVDVKGATFDPNDIVEIKRVK